MRSKPVLQIFFSMLLAIACTGCGKPSLVRYREAKPLFGTMVQIDVCSSRDQEELRSKAYGEVWKRLEEIHWRMNVFDDTSDVAKINRSFRKPATIGVDTYALLRDSVGYTKLTGGAFDITVWPLIELWRKGEKTQRVPDSRLIQKVRRAVGPQNIRFLPDARVEVLNKGTKVDLGGIAGGYAVDEAARILRENGFKQFFIDAGGDIYVGGRNCENRAWRIGISDPRDPAKILEVVELTNAAVATSGNYEKYYQIAGKRWSHIMNPMTGYPQQEVASATVIAPTALWTDALSTALCVLDPAQGRALIDAQGEGFAAMVITPAGGSDIKRFESRRYSRWKAARP